MTDEDYCELNGVVVRQSAELPYKCGGVCYHDEDGREYILINLYCSPEKQKRSFRHEVRHLRRGEMYDIRYREY